MNRFTAIIPNEGVAKVLCLTLTGRKTSFSIDWLEHGWMFAVGEQDKDAFPKGTVFQIEGQTLPQENVDAGQNE